MLVPGGVPRRRPPTPAARPCSFPAEGICLPPLLSTFHGPQTRSRLSRAFLDNVVTQALVAEGGGKWREYVGGYSDWLVQRPGPAPAASPAPERERKPAPRAPQKVKLTFKETRELESLPAEIEALEREQHDLTARMASADYHRQGPEQLKADRRRAEEIERLLEGAFERWSALEQKAREAGGG
jgi:ABC transport system ATP-binding/permease protein